MTHSRTSRRTSRRVIVPLVVGLVLAACGNSGDDDDTATTEAPASTDAVATTVAETADTTAETTADTTAETTEDTTDDTTAGTTEDTTEDTTATTEPAAAEPNIGTFEPVEGVPGVTDEEISFAVLGTGPSNPLGYCLLECYQRGVQAYFDYQNSLGGANGRDLVIGVVADDEVGATQVKSLELIGDDSIFGIFGAPLQYAGYADIGAAGVPLYTTFPAAGDANGFDNIYIPGGTMCVDCLNPASVNGAVVAGGTRAASIGFGVSQASKDCVNRTEAEYGVYGAAAGVEFVYKNDDLPFGFPNGLGPEVTAMKEAGVDYISTCVDQGSVLILEQELERQGMGDSVIVALPQGYSDTEFLSTNADLLEGNILSVSYRPFEADPGNSNIQIMRDAFDATGEQINDYSIQGWLGAELAVAGIIAAGPQFDRASVVAATNSFTEWTNSGMMPPVDWSTAHNARTDADPGRFCAAYVKIVNGTTEMLSDPAKPWKCFDLPLAEWAPPTDTAF
jgi:branched-chain amino acid transport system substrate-binding protein